MEEQNNNPAATPSSDQGPAPGDQNPAAGNDNQNQGNEEEVKLSKKEYDRLFTNAGRWENRNKDRREKRRAERNRDSNSNQDDNTDPDTIEALRDRDEKINELSSKNFRLELKDKIVSTLTKDDYKDVPEVLKKAIARNPKGFIDSESSTLEDAVLDIEEYLDRELDSMDANINRQSGNSADNPNANIPGSGLEDKSTQNDVERNIPPARGSGPSDVNVNPQDGIEGKVGTDRSTTILKNLFKGKK